MLDKIYAKKDNVVARQIAGEDMLIPVRGALADMQKLHVQEGIGTFIWARLDGEKTLSEIAKEIELTYEVGSAEASDDLVAFIEDLSEASLIEARA